MEIYITKDLIDRKRGKADYLIPFDCDAGGTFALYSLLCRHARLCILPNQEPVDEQLSAYDIKGISETRPSAALKSFFRLHPSFRRGFLLFVLFGTCMAIGDGVLTPAISGQVPAFYLCLFNSVA